MGTGQAHRHMDERSHEKSSRQDPHGHQTVILQPAQALCRPRQGQDSAAPQDSRRKNTFRDVHRFSFTTADRPAAVLTSVCAYFFSGAVKSIQITAPSSTSLGEPW